MESFQDLAIVLRSVLFEEKHRMVTAITERHGKISVVARNAIGSRRFGGAVDPFTASLLTLKERPGSDVYFLEEATVRRGFEGLRNELDLFTSASLFNEIILRIAPERAATPELFKLHANALAALEEDPSRWRGCVLAFFLRILHWCGHDPRWSVCYSCQSGVEAIAGRHSATSPVLGVIDAAAWVCPDCHARHGQARVEGHVVPLTLHAILVSAISVQSPMRQAFQAFDGLDASEKTQLFQFLERLTRYHVPGLDQAPLKALQLLTF